MPGFHMNVTIAAIAKKKTCSAIAAIIWKRLGLLLQRSRYDRCIDKTSSIVSAMLAITAIEISPMAFASADTQIIYRSLNFGFCSNDSSFSFFFPRSQPSNCNNRGDHMETRHKGDSSKIKHSS